MVNNSKEIFERQNLPGFVVAQKSASSCYSIGKRWATILVVLSVVFPVIINIILTLFNIDILNGCLILASVICFILSEFIRLLIKKWKFYGAGMQQYFDEFVFSLKNSCKKYIYPKKLTQYERIRLMTKFQDKDDKPFQNWYSDFSSLSYEDAVYQCQKQNIRWDIYIRQKYLIFLITVSVIIILGIIFHAIMQMMDVFLLLTIISTLLPIGMFLYNGIKKLFKDIKNQTNLFQHIESIEKKLNKKKLWDEIEELQLEIFEYRKNAYLIPDWFYKIFRENKQKEEDEFAKKISNN